MSKPTCFGSFLGGNVSAERDCEQCVLYDLCRDVTAQLSHPHIENDPHGRAPHEPGAKLDAGKTQASLLLDFSLALTAVADVATYGAGKYTRGGWQEVPEGIARYSDAMWRHMLKERREFADKDSQLPHAAHLAWNALARLELMLRRAEDE